MRIGIPREIKTLEGRVALVPAACGDLVQAGHEVFIEAGAGNKSGFCDEDFTQIGVKVLPDAEALYGKAELVVKVKEPIDGDLQYLRSDHLLFCYLHLAAEPKLTDRLLDIGLTGVAFETVEEDDGTLPLLAPMSNIAGRIGVQVGTHLLHQPEGGRGVLLGGLPAADRGHVVVLGAGAAGGNSARLAAASGARVTVFDKRQDRLAEMMAVGPNVTALYPYGDTVTEFVSKADLVIGAVLVTGARAPHVTYQVDGVTHFAVTNMPGAVPRTSSQALSAAILPYVQHMARPDWKAVEALTRGVNVRDGALVHPALKQA